ncbi:MAG: hypothetical protein NTW05_21730, partial [Pseudonocardiales bacterium]|nr:hypothetical protein [Pseudonocardiales bacterium]
GGAGGSGGTNSADQTVSTSNAFSFTDSFTADDNDGFDLKDAEIEDSFNQDNDGVDNSHGEIEDSVVAGGNANNSGNETDLTVVSNSYNDNDSQTLTNVGNTTNTQTWTNVGNDNSTDIDDSFTTETEVEVEDSFNTFDPDLLDIDVQLDDVLPVNLGVLGN